ncbi:MAG: type II secretion system GspH family protein [Cyanosarcina radialis HA8281-LM2]|jgi:type II secretory pathway pseudopilin PulG|nr:type II secretion system GspH family protein [Cyanosarcina radialis HA8281-LM2]
MLKKSPKKLHSTSGFTLVEVLVGMLMATIFVAVTMQSMVVGSLLKSRARQYSEGTTWIQEDLEKLKYQAATYKYTTLAANATPNTIPPATDVEIEVTSDDDFDVGDKIKIGTESDIYTINSKSGNTLTISPNLKKNQSATTRVVEISRCGITTAVDRTSGFADGLRDKYIGSDRVGNEETINEDKISKLKQTQVGGATPTPDAGQQGFELKKTLTIADVAPYNLLQVKYEIRPTDNLAGEPVAQMYTTIVPNAALFCPL